MATERIQIIVSERGSRTVRRNLRDIGDDANRAEGAVSLLRRTLGLIGTGLAVRELANLSDAGTELANKLAIAEGVVGPLNNGFERLISIANNARAPIEELGVLFQRGAIAAGELGASNEDLFNFVDTVAKGLAIQGGAAKAARGALIQLAQSLGSGIVRAEEFNSVLEGAFPIALAAAKGLDAAGGSVAKLRQLIITGKVASDEFFKAILSQQAELTDLFERSTPTIGQSFTVLRNNLIQSVRDFNESTGAAVALSSVILALSNNIDVLAEALAAFAIGALTLAIGRATLAVGAFITQSVALQLALGATSASAALAGASMVTLQRGLLALRAAVLANPLTALAAVLASIAAALILFESDAEKAAEAVKELNSDVRGIQKAFIDADEDITKVSDRLGEMSQSAVLARQSLLEMAKDEVFKDLVGNAGSLVAAMRELEGATVEQQLQIARLAAEAIKGERDLSDLRKAVDDLGAGSEVLRPFVLKLIETIDAADRSKDALERNAAVLRVLANTASRADLALLGLANATDSVAAGADGASDAIKQLNKFIPALAKAAEAQEDIAAAQEIYRQGQARIRASVEAGVISADRAASATQQLSETYNNAISEIDGTAEALRDVNEELEEQSSRAALAGLTGLERTLADEAEKYKELKEALVEAGASTDQLAAAEANYQAIVAGAKSADAGKGSKKRSGRAQGTVGDIFADLEAESIALRKSSREREIYLDLLSADKFLKGELSRADAIQIEGMLRENQALRDQAIALEEIRGPAEELERHQAAIEVLFMQGAISAEEYARALEKIGAAQLGLNQSFGGGFTESINQATLSTKEFGSAVGGIVVGSINSASDAIVQFAQTGKLNIRQLFAELFAQLLRLAAQQLLLKLVGAMLGVPALPGGIVPGTGGSGLPFPIPGNKTGADFMVGGSGGPDSQLVAFRASPNERVLVQTPAQQKAMSEGGGGEQKWSQVGDTKIINVLDPSIVGKFLATGDGERAVINIVKTSGLVSER